MSIRKLRQIIKEELESIGMPNSYYKRSVGVSYDDASEKWTYTDENGKEMKFHFLSAANAVAKGKSLKYYVTFNFVGTKIEPLKKLASKCGAFDIEESFDDDDESQLEMYFQTESEVFNFVKEVKQNYPQMRKKYGWRIHYIPYIDNKIAREANTEILN